MQNCETYGRLLQQSVHVPRRFLPIERMAWMVFMVTCNERMAWMVVPRATAKNAVKQQTPNVTSYVQVL